VRLPVAALRCTVTSVRYREHRPSSRLASAVACLWTLEGHASDLDEGTQPILPDGRAELVVHFGETFERRDPGAAPLRQAPALFAGQLERPLDLRPTGRIEVLGVRFHPDGAARFVAPPQHELIGTTLDIGLVSPTLARTARIVRESAPTPPDAVALMDRWLTSTMPDAPRDRRVAAVVRAIVRSGGLMSIDRTAAATGLSRRHLERLFLRDVGVPPKQLARIVRFQRTLRMLERESEPPRGLRAAHAGGYADQAHFIREFRALAGCAPGEHLLRRAELTGIFTGARDDGPADAGHDAEP
jgi:AraC-like DNA-binding protein